MSEQQRIADDDREEQRMAEESREQRKISRLETSFEVSSEVTARPHGTRRALQHQREKEQDLKAEGNKESPKKYH